MPPSVFPVERHIFELTEEFAVDSSLIVEHGYRLSNPAQQPPQPTSQQSGRWAGLNVRRIPAQVVKALLNRFPRSSIKCCQNILTVSAIALMNTQVIRQVNDYEVIASVKGIAGLGMALAWNYGMLWLDSSLNHFIDKVGVEIMNSGGDVPTPDQQLTSITTQLKCRKEVVSKIKLALKDGRMSNIHLRELLRLFRDVIALEMKPEKNNLLKIRHILTMLSSNPEMTPVAATQATMESAYCDDGILSRLEQIHVWAMTEKLFEDFNRDRSIRELMIGLQSAYAESVFLETMQSINVPGSKWLFDSGLLVGLSDAASIYVLYKRILYKAGVCEFLAPPPRFEDCPFRYRVFTPDSTVFYQFQEVFLNKLSNVDAFFSFVQNLITVEKEYLFLRKNHQLRQLIDQKSDQDCSELEQLAQLQAQGEITEYQYFVSSNRLMDRHKREMAEIWLGYISEQFLRLPERAKTILHSKPGVPPGRSTAQLASAYR